MGNDVIDRLFQYNQPQLAFLASYYSERLERKISIKRSSSYTSKFDNRSGNIFISEQNLVNFYNFNSKLFMSLFYTLVSHEIGHAVHTGDLPYSTVGNIMEDVRLEFQIAKWNSVVRFDLMRFAQFDRELKKMIDEKKTENAFCVQNALLLLFRSVSNKRAIELFSKTKRAVQIIHELLELKEEYQCYGYTATDLKQQFAADILLNLIKRIEKLGKELMKECGANQQIGNDPSAMLIDPKDLPEYGDDADDDGGSSYTSADDDGDADDDIDIEDGSEPDEDGDESEDADAEDGDESEEADGDDDEESDDDADDEDGDESEDGEEADESEDGEDGEDGSDGNGGGNGDGQSEEDLDAQKEIDEMDEQKQQEELEDEIEKQTNKADDIKDQLRYVVPRMINENPIGELYRQYKIEVFDAKRRQGIKGFGDAARDMGTIKELDIRKYARRHVVDGEKLFNKPHAAETRGGQSMKVTFYLDISTSMREYVKTTDEMNQPIAESKIKILLDYVRSFYDRMNKYVEIKIYAFGANMWELTRKELELSFIVPKMEEATIIYPLPMRDNENVIIVTDGEFHNTIPDIFARKAHFVQIISGDWNRQLKYKNVYVAKTGDIVRGMNQATQSIRAAFSQ